MAKPIVRTRVPDDVRRAIVAEYQTGLSQDAVARLHNLSQSTIGLVLLQEGVELRRYHKLNEEQKEQVVQFYADGESCQEIAQRFGMDQSSVWSLLKRRGVRIRSASECNRTYELDQAAFDVATDEAATWVGFLMADGCVIYRGEQSASLSLSLAERDADHVYRFRDFLKSTHPITIEDNKKSPDSNAQPLYRLCVSSKRLVDAVGKYGVIPRKTWNATVIGLCDHPRFWQGMVDGDGEVSLYPGRGKRENPVLGLVGTYTLIEQFVRFVKQSIGYTAKIRSEGSIFAVKLNGRFAIQMAHVLYDNAVVALPRKLATAKRFFAMESSIRVLGTNPPICVIGGCHRKPVAHGLCRYHYNQERYFPPASGDKFTLPRNAQLPKCTAPGCNRDNFAHGLCQMHAGRKTKRARVTAATTARRQS